MRRPSRSFTVEVKRSRSRAGEVAAAEPRSAPPASLPSSLSSSLSWGDLVSRATEELGGELGGGSGGETPPARAAVHEAAHGGNAPEAVHARQAGAAPSRVLPSLLPAETPLSGRRAGIRESGTTPYGTDSPVSPRSRLPGQGRAPAPPTELRRTPAPIDTPAPAPAAPETAAPETIGTLDAGRIRAMVEQHLRRQSVTGERLAEAAGGEDAAAHHEVDASPAGRRRRGDFWKRRLRSYAARD